MAHEVGHYLGLFHTSELFGAQHDALDDTPRDDTQNLMHFSTSGDQLSHHQAVVAANNPWVRSP